MVNLDKIEEIIAGVEIGFVLTRNGTKLHGRPLATLCLDENASLWFFIRSDSDLVEEIQEDPMIHITYNDIYNGNYLLIRGSSSIVRDPVKKQKLWNPALKKWLQGDPDDDNMLLLKIEISESAYWDKLSGKMCEEEAEKNTDEPQVIPIRRKSDSDEQFGHQGVI